MRKSMIGVRIRQKTTKYGRDDFYTRSHKVYIRSTQGLHKVYTRSTQGLHRVYIRSTQGLHKVYIRST